MFATKPCIQKLPQAMRFYLTSICTPYNPYNLYKLLVVLVGVVDVPVVPVILGILLGEHMEVSLRRAMVLSDGDWTYLFSSNISIGLWVAAIIGFLAPIFLRPYLTRPKAQGFTRK